MSKIEINDLPEPKKDRLNFREVGMLQGLITNSLITSRTNLLGTSLDTDPNRDINNECSYPEFVTLDNYYQMFERSGYAKRAVSIHADETWSVVPEIWETEDEKETPFEAKWNDLMFEINVWHYLYRADMLSGLGQFGILFIGLDDGKELDQPVDGINPKTGRLDEKTRRDGAELLFLRPFSQKEVQIMETESDQRSPRHGLPTFYGINFSDPASILGGDMRDNLTPSTTTEMGTKVHWTRVLHVADNRLSSEVLGTPRQQHVYNRLLDLRKILGGSGEMFWKGAFPGYSFETNPEYAAAHGINKESIRDEFEEYYNGLKRYIALSGMTVKPLLPQVADPTSHVTENLREITTCLTVPMRIFLGSESGHLASTQDISTWNKRVAKRQTDYINPMMIIPLVRRLMYAGVLPVIKKFTISWTDLNALSDAEKADIALKRAQALLQYTTSGSETVMPLFQFLTLVLGYTVEQAMAIQGVLDTQKGDMYTQPIWEQPAAPTAGSGPKDSTKKTNRQSNSQSNG